MVRPDYARYHPYSEENMLRELSDKLPDYLFDAGDIVSFGPGSKVLRKVVAKYPALFDEIKSNPAPNSNYKLYRLNKSLLRLNQQKINNLNFHS